MGFSATLNFQKFKSWNVLETVLSHLKSLEYEFSKRFWFNKGDSSHFENSPSFQISLTCTDVFRINENFIQQLSATFSCRDSKDGKLSYLVTHMMSFSANQNVQSLYSPLEMIIQIIQRKDVFNPFTMSIITRSENILAGNMFQACVKRLLRQWFSVRCSALNKKSVTKRLLSLISK